jgi:anti-anti-sigma regulatory factor
MLMITCIESSDAGRLLKLEGKLREPWLDELRSACVATGTPPTGLRLDLTALTFIDEAGAQFLDSLIRQGATVIACSPFVAEMLDINQG